MEHDFWHKRWAEQRIGFHQESVNKFLETHYSALNLAPGAQVFVPLCGKSSDMLWLREQACHVLGVELSDTACEAFFAENGGAVEKVLVDGFYQREKDEIVLLCGDFFKLSADKLGSVGAVYDRAALIALPEELRRKYAKKMIECLPKGVKVLLVTLEFEGEAGPPFSVSADEVRALFSDRFDITKLASECPGEGKDAGRTEIAWLLNDRTLGR